ncbi:MAG: hypothetical protein IJL79_02725, partial [Candidatus Methanomethylophilaceae archaeon]|nr:hypothetical protein [Candidatus Methanomethylophilaceae archaeon]
MSTSDAVKEASDRLAQLERKRNMAVESSRAITRRTKNMIHAIHVHDDYGDIAKDLQRDVDSVNAELS